MSSLDPASLSPLATGQVACGLPYGLTWEDLLPALPGFVPETVPAPLAFASHVKQGQVGFNGGDNSCILTLRYPVGAGQERAETLFFKRNLDPAQAEAAKYRILARNGIPTPRLIAVLRKGDAEVLVLEFLPSIGIDFASIGEVTSLLRLVAQINSARDLPAFFDLPPAQPHEAFDGNVHATLVDLSREAAFPGMDVDRWFAAYDAAQQARSAMPAALNHGEFYFQQVGWAQHGLERQLVVFDLETMSVRPRFTDLASILYPLAIHAGQGEEDLFRFYLDCLGELQGSAPDLDAALREFRLLRITEACYTLPWLNAEARNKPANALREQLVLTMGCLRADLRALDYI